MAEPKDDEMIDYPDEKPVLKDVPSVSGDQNIGGSQPDPSSDDNALDAVQETGRYLDTDEEHPKPLGE